MKIFILVGVLSCVYGQDKQDFKWGYERHNGPETWGTHWKECNGLRQSPIVLPTVCEDVPSLQRIEFHDYIDDYYNLQLINEGDAIKFYLKGSDRPSISGSVFGANDRYLLDQLILRFGSQDNAGSEHGMNGKRYPGEDQRIWFNSKFASFEEALKVPGNVAVTSHLFEVTQEDNPFLDPAVNGVHLINGTDEPIDFVHKFALTPDYRINVFEEDNDGWMRCINCDYYFYEGSLSFPPCTEGVLWHVYMDTYKISERQLNVLRSLVSPNDKKPMVNNFRNKQPVNFRDIYQHREKSPVGECPIPERQFLHTRQQLFPDLLRFRPRLTLPSFPNPLRKPKNYNIPLQPFPYLPQQVIFHPLPSSFPPMYPWSQITIGGYPHITPESRNTAIYNQAINPSVQQKVLMLQEWDGHKKKDNAREGHSLDLELEDEVQIRLFTPDNYNRNVERRNKQAVWNLGQNLACSSLNDFFVQPPPNFDPNLPLKVISSGFMVSCFNHCTNYVNAWMDKSNQRANVILLEWLKLSRPIDLSLREFVTNPNPDIYNKAARNAIDVGEYVGKCLAAFWRQSVDGNVPHIHLVGASLGAHLVGTAARTYHKITGKQVDRVTGLDPAGPDFIDGPVLDKDEWLHSNRLNRDDAKFVDVIHTHASTKPAVINPFNLLKPRFGDLNPLGDADFYPDGGEEQNNCGWTEFGCSHKRSAEYYVNSIMEPYLFPSYECNGLDMCTKPEYYDLTGPANAYMGEDAVAEQDSTKQSKMYFLKIDKDSKWDYYGHWEEDKWCLGEFFCLR